MKKLIEALLAYAQTDACVASHVRRLHVQTIVNLRDKSYRQLMEVTFESQASNR